MTHGKRVVVMVAMFCSKDENDLPLFCHFFCCLFRSTDFMVIKTCVIFLFLLNNARHRRKILEVKHWKAGIFGHDDDEKANNFMIVTVSWR